MVRNVLIFFLKSHANLEFNFEYSYQAFSTLKQSISHVSSGKEEGIVLQNVNAIRNGYKILHRDHERGVPNERGGSSYYIKKDYTLDLTSELYRGLFPFSECPSKENVVYEVYMDGTIIAERQDKQKPDSLYKIRSIQDAISIGELFCHVLLQENRHFDISSIFDPTNIVSLYASHYGNFNLSDEFKIQVVNGIERNRTNLNTFLKGNPGKDVLNYVEDSMSTFLVSNFDLSVLDTSKKYTPTHGSFYSHVTVEDTYSDSTLFSMSMEDTNAYLDF